MDKRPRPHRQDRLGRSQHRRRYSALFRALVVKNDAPEFHSG